LKLTQNTTDTRHSTSKSSTRERETTQHPRAAELEAEKTCALPGLSSSSSAAYVKGERICKCSTSYLIQNFEAAVSKKRLGEGPGCALASYLWGEKKNGNNKIPNQKGSRHCCRGTVFYWEVKTRDAPNQSRVGAREGEEEDCVSRD
jgi:hypothetical protein